MILTVIVLYLAVVLSVGLFAHRRSRGTGEDFYVASRSIGPFVLLMTLFGTNMTAFSILGASGEAYRQGILVYALMGSSSALVVLEEHPEIRIELGSCDQVGNLANAGRTIEGRHDSFVADSGEVGPEWFTAQVEVRIPRRVAVVLGANDLEILAKALAKFR